MKKIEYYSAKIKQNKLLLITAAMVLIAAVAAVLFYLNEESKTISIEQADKQSAVDDSVAEKGETENVYVDIGGCVKKPGVYEVSAGSRIFEVIEKAGGITEDADTSTVNQAEAVSDGLKIIIPDKRNTAGNSAVSDQTGSTVPQQDDMVNINSSDSSALTELPGIGPVTAEKIVLYREENGYFKSIEDIKNVNGIGEKTYQKIKTKITV